VASNYRNPGTTVQPPNRRFWYIHDPFINISDAATHRPNASIETRIKTEAEGVDLIIENEEVVF
jgi:hypothetical protein